MPSPAIATTRPCSCSRLTARPSGRAAPRRRPRRCRACAPTASAVVRLSPVSMTTRRPSLAQRRSASARRSLIGSATPSKAGRASVDRDEHHASGHPRRSSSARFGAARRDRCSSSSSSAALPSATRCPSTAPTTPLPVSDAKSSGGAERQRHAPRRPATIAAASGCSLPRSRLAASRSSVVLVDRRRAATTPTSARLALGQRAGLVDDERVDLLHRLRALRRS